MAKSLVRGEKLVLGNISTSLHSLQLEFVYQTNYKNKVDIDFLLFMVDQCNQIPRERIVFYNHPTAPCGSVEYKEEYEAKNHKKSFMIHLEKVPVEIERLIITAIIYKEKSTYLPAPSLELDMAAYDKTFYTDIFSYREDIDLKMEEALIIGEIYKHKNTWKFSNVQHKGKGNILSLLKEFYSF